GGGPFVARVAQHVLDRVADPALLKHVRENGRWLGRRLEALRVRSRQVRAVRGVGLIWGVDVVSTAADVIGRARDLGLLLVSAGEHTIRFLPPLVVTRAELARGLDLFEA